MGKYGELIVTIINPDQNYPPLKIHTLYNVVVVVLSIAMFQRKHRLHQEPSWYQTRGDSLTRRFIDIRWVPQPSRGHKVRVLSHR